MSPTPSRATSPDDKLQVELHGLDVYDPTTHEIRSDSSDGIACWFVAFADGHIA